MIEYRMDEIFELQMGKTPSRGKQEYWVSKGHKWISIADLSKCGKYISETKEYLSDEAVNESGISLIPANTVLLSFKLSIGKVAITAEPMYSNEAIMSFRDRQVVELLPEYTYYMFLGKDWDSGTNKAVMGKTLNKATLSAIRIKVHDISKQREIVRVLSKVDELIVARQQQLAKLDELVKARFVEMFICKDNPMVTLDSLTLGKSEYGAQSASAEYDSNRPRYIRITDINDDGTLNNDIVSSANIEDDQRYKLTYGDFLFARMGATVGKTYAYKSGDQIFAGYLIRYKLNLQKIMPEYLFAYTKLEKYKKWVLLNQSGAAQPGINAKKYGSLQIPLAPLEEQRAFTNFVRQTDKSRLLIRKSLEQMETLKKALMQQYFG